MFTSLPEAHGDGVAIKQNKKQTQSCAGGEIEREGEREGERGGGGGRER